MKLDTAGWTDKDSKRPEYRSLYESLPFLEAYSKHTDMRIAADGPELAIGAKRDGKQDWDIHGNMQLNFLISQGLRQDSTLLDIGCGTGRLACKAVPYLNKNCYTGIDISHEAICHSIQSSNRMPDMRVKLPLFVFGNGTLDKVRLDKFDYVWAHSVVTHLPEDIVSELLMEISEMDVDQFFFTYKSSVLNQRSGLKQFQYSAHWLKTTGNVYGLKVEPVEFEFPAGQHVMKAWRA